MSLLAQNGRLVLTEEQQNKLWNHVRELTNLSELSEKRVIPMRTSAPGSCLCVK